jgi:hypothetical protein
MSLDVSEPIDQRLVSQIPKYIRQNRAAINALVSGAGFGTTALGVAGGTTSLTVGVDLLAVGHEVVIVTGVGVATLETIVGGTNGQIKTFIFQDSNVDLKDGVKANGKFYLNHLPALSDFTPDSDDVLELINVDGDGAAVHGYWKESYRTYSVK